MFYHIKRDGKKLVLQGITTSKYNTHFGDDFTHTGIYLKNKLTDLCILKTFFGGLICKREWKVLFSGEFSVILVLFIELMSKVKNSW